MSQRPAGAVILMRKCRMRQEVGGLRGDKQTMKGRGPRDEFLGGQGRNSSFTRGFLRSGGRSEQRTKFEWALAGLGG
jgi:hypothetical protein